MAALEKNTSGLPPSAVNIDIDEQFPRREKNMDDGLDYACRSWAKHLRLASRDGNNVSDVVQSLQDFFSHHMSHWLHIVKDYLASAVCLLRGARAWLEDVSVSMFFSSSLFIEHKYTGYDLRCTVVSCHQEDRRRCAQIS
jgi:hypothetical protein